jgi:hypothetical protein
MLTKTYRLADDRVSKVRSVAHWLTQQRGYRVTLEMALAEIVDAFSLPVRSTESPKSTEETADARALAEVDA